MRERPSLGGVKGSCTEFSIVSCHVSHCQARDLQRGSKGAFYTFTHLGEGESDCVTVHQLTNNQTLPLRHLVTQHSDRSWRPELGLWVILLYWFPAKTWLICTNSVLNDGRTRLRLMGSLKYSGTTPSQHHNQHPRNMEAMCCGPCSLNFPFFPFSPFTSSISPGPICAPT